MIDTLIDKQDTFEIVGLKIGQILADESAAQMLLAAAAVGKDPLQWKLRVYTEKFDPFEQWLNIDEDTDKSPIVNVWFDNSNYDKGASDLMERQWSESVFNIDCYGLGIAHGEGAGHKPGDQEAAAEAHRTMRLVRNIIMADIYTYLDMDGIVGERWPSTFTSFQVPQEQVTYQRIVGGRLALQVKFNEFSPQETPVILEGISNVINRASDGQLLAAVDYDY